MNIFFTAKDAKDAMEDRFLFSFAVKGGSLFHPVNSRSPARSAA